MLTSETKVENDWRKILHCTFVDFLFWSSGGWKNAFSTFFTMLKEKMKYLTDKATNNFQKRLSLKEI